LAGLGIKAIVMREAKPNEVFQLRITRVMIQVGDLSLVFGGMVEVQGNAHAASAPAAHEYGSFILGRDACAAHGRFRQRNRKCRHRRLEWLHLLAGGRWPRRDVPFKLCELMVIRMVVQVSMGPACDECLSGHPQDTSEVWKVKRSSRQIVTKPEDSGRANVVAVSRRRISVQKKSQLLERLPAGCRPTMLVAQRGRRLRRGVSEPL
jgi:hypothetical protein